MPIPQGLFLGPIGTFARPLPIKADGNEFRFQARETTNLRFLARNNGANPVTIRIITVFYTYPMEHAHEFEQGEYER